VIAGRAFATTVLNTTCARHSFHTRHVIEWGQAGRAVLLPPGMQSWAAGLNLKTTVPEDGPPPGQDASLCPWQHNLLELLKYFCWKVALVEGVLAFPPQDP
jgi:hypothetical protein